MKEQNVENNKTDNRKRCEHIYQRARGDIKPGDRCTKRALTDSKLCVKHNQMVLERAKRQLRERASTRLRQFTELEPETSDLLDPFSLLAWETRRSVARIKWYDDQILSLEDEKALWWSLVKEETINAAEIPGTNRTYEQRAHALVEMQDKERIRLEKLFTFWQNTKMEAARIATVGVFKVETNKIIRAILAEFEIDTNDEFTRERVASVLMERGAHLTEALEAPKELRG